MLVLGGAVGYIFCSGMCNSENCAYFGLPYLQSVIIGIGVVAVVLGIGGGVGISLRVLYAFHKEYDLNDSKIRRDIYWVSNLSIYALFGAFVLIESLA